MNVTDNLETRLAELGKASRRAALLTIFGVAIVLASAAYAYLHLRSLQDSQRALVQQQERLIRDTQDRQQQLVALQAALAKSRAALSSARAAINAFHAGHLADAVALYDEALASDPDNAYLQNLRAYSLFVMGRVSDAIEGEKRSVAADPNYAWGYFDLARFLYASTPLRLEEAQTAEARAIELRPGMKTIMSSDGEYQRLRKKALAPSD